MQSLSQGSGFIEQDRRTLRRRFSARFATLRQQHFPGCRAWVPWIVFALICSLAGVSDGQVILKRLREARTRLAENRMAENRGLQDDPLSLCPQIVRAEAWMGEPFGVGVVSFRLPPGQIDGVDPAMLLRTGAVQITDREGRILYPAESQPAAARFFRGVFGSADDPTAQIYSTWFIFRGDQPLQLQVVGCEGTTVELVPKVARENQYSRLLKQWWREYTRIANEQTEQGDYPDLVETYLTRMLEFRQGLEPVRQAEKTGDPLQETLNLLMDAESIRSDLVRRWFAGAVDTGLPNLPPPPPIPWTPIPGRNLPQQVPVEAMAMVVPEECFYLRFGTWDNQIWLKRLVAEHGGDLGRMIQMRGHAARIQSRFLDQLALESTQLDQLFGGTLIRDVAVIGLDTLFGSGPSVGVLLESSDSQALEKRIRARREKFDGRGVAEVQLATVEIEGLPVSFLSSADNRFRSFHVVQGDHHLFTNSRTLAARFIRAARGEGSLGKSEEFRYARTRMPLERNDTIFIYFPTGFFRQLLTPQHQIELLRRSQIVTEMQLSQLARSAAANEGYPDAPIEFLVGNGFLPKSFGQRPQGSTVRFDAAGWTDSVRGRHGFFLPAADMELTGVTEDETEWFRMKTAYFLQSVQQLEPLMIGLRRFADEDNTEQIVFDAELAPFGQSEYGWIDSMLGPPLRQYIVGANDDVVRLQVSMKRNRPDPAGEYYQMFAAIQDELAPDVDLQAGSWLDVWRVVKQVPGYIGSTPPAGMVDWLPRLGGRPDIDGYSHSRLLGLSRLQFGDFSVLAFDPARLERLRGELQMVPAERAAQVRLSVADLSGSEIGNWLNVIYYRRAWQTSVANARLLNTLIEQFGVEPANAMTFAEDLLDVRLVCALNGEYRMAGSATRPVWVSTAWPSFSAPEMPGTYDAPLLGWFRGLELELNRVDSHYEVHGVMRIQRSGDASVLPLPGADLLKGFGDLLPGLGFGGGNRNAPAPKEQERE